MTQEHDKGWSPAIRALNQKIRRELKRFPSDRVDRFVGSIGPTLGNYRLMREMPDEKGRRRSLEQLRKATLAFSRALREPVLGHAYPRRLDLVDAFPPLASVLQHHRARTFYDAFNDANDAARILFAETERVLAEMPRRRGRHCADDLGLLAKLARRYQTIFDELPKSTPGRTFYNVAIYVLEHVNGRMPKDIERQVRAALKTPRRRN